MRLKNGKNVVIVDVAENVQFEPVDQWESDVVAHHFCYSFFEEIRDLQWIHCLITSNKSPELLKRVVLQSIRNWIRMFFMVLLQPILIFLEIDFEISEYLVN